MTSLWFYKFAPLEQIGIWKTIKPGSVVVEFNLDAEGKLIYYKIINLIHNLLLMKRLKMLLRISRDLVKCHQKIWLLIKWY